MQDLSSIIKKTIDTTDTSNITTTDISRIKYNTGGIVKGGYDNDRLFNELKSQSLVNDEFRARFCGAFYKLGKSYTLQLAGIARAEGDNPQRYFSFLIKKALC